VVYPEALELEDGKLSGEIVVRYRADAWTEPLVAEGTTAAARYTFEATLAKGDRENVGRYDGRYGVAWSKEAALTGRVEE
jgi:hypothetical protein